MFFISSIYYKRNLVVLLYSNLSLHYKWHVYANQYPSLFESRVCLLFIYFLSIRVKYALVKACLHHTHTHLLKQLILRSNFNVVIFCSHENRKRRSHKPIVSGFLDTYLFSILGTVFV